MESKVVYIISRIIINHTWNINIPMQWRGPSPNGKNVPFGRLDFSSAVNLSGSKVSGFG